MESKIFEDRQTADANTVRARLVSEMDRGLQADDGLLLVRFEAQRDCNCGDAECRGTVKVQTVLNKVSKEDFMYVIDMLVGDDINFANRVIHEMGKRIIAHIAAQKKEEAATPPYPQTKKETMQ